MSSHLINIKQKAEEDAVRNLIISAPLAYSLRSSPPTLAVVAQDDSSSRILTTTWLVKFANGPGLLLLKTRNEKVKQRTNSSRSLVSKQQTVKKEEGKKLFAWIHSTASLFPPLCRWYSTYVSQQLASSLFLGKLVTLRRGNVSLSSPIERHEEEGNYPFLWLATWKLWQGGKGISKAKGRREIENLHSTAIPLSSGVESNVAQIKD